MAAGGGEARPTVPDAARPAREHSPSIAELMIDSMVYDYDSDSGEVVGRFSPTMLYANMGFGEYDEYGSDFLDSDEEFTSGAPAPPWEGGGYDCQFVSDVPNTLQCLICATVAREAQQVDCCGKVFCKGCLYKLKRARNKACPNCRKGKWKSFSDKKSEREIESLVVKCSNGEHGCKWEGELRSLRKHVLDCNKELIPCKYQSIGCKAKVVKKGLIAHEEACTTQHLKMAVEKVNLLTQQTFGALPTLPPVVLKMSGFLQHRTSKTIWDSPPFFTHRSGYRLYLRINVFGTDNYGRECVSAMVCLVCGENDANLMWPFRGTIDFRLLNQDRDEDHIIADAKFLERRESSKNKRVNAAEGKSTVGWGARDLLLFSDPHFSSYMQRDCLFFSVDKAEVSVLNKPWLI